MDVFFFFLLSEMIIKEESYRYPTGLPCRIITSLRYHFTDLGSLPGELE